MLLRSAEVGSLLDRPATRWPGQGLREAPKAEGSPPHPGKPSPLLLPGPGLGVILAAGNGASTGRKTLSSLRSCLGEGSKLPLGQWQPFFLF